MWSKTCINSTTIFPSANVECISDTNTVLIQLFALFYLFCFSNRYLTLYLRQSLLIILKRKQTFQISFFCLKLQIITKEKHTRNRGKTWWPIDEHEFRIQTQPVNSNTSSAITSSMSTLLLFKSALASNDHI